MAKNTRTTTTKNSSKTNDDVVMQLRARIDEKKAALKASKTFTPKTNCSLTLSVIGGTERINLHVIDAQTITYVLVALNALRLSALELGLLHEYKISGYHVQDWIDDLYQRLTILDRKNQEQQLKALEDRLYTLLSNDKKVELEIDSIAKLID